MVMGDNDLLTEWIPYHYTVLPLRTVLVVSDHSNHEDPNDILKRYKIAKIDLDYKVVNASVFDHIHGPYLFDEQKILERLNRDLQKKGRATINSTDHPLYQQDIAHHHLIHKQLGLISYCVNYMKEQGIRWVTLFDTDEFLAVNRLGLDDIRVATNNKESDSDQSKGRFQQRRHLPPIDSNDTLVDIIHSFEQIDEALESCHLMPRITFGALDNFTCQGSETVQEFARYNFHYEILNTLRFQQHANKDDFSKNRFGKVFLDLNGIDDLSSKPRNIHRPFPKHCIRPVATVKESPFYLMHYVGGWERFQAKSDKRRDYEAWKQRASIDDSTSCCQEKSYTWLFRFVDEVGLDRAKFLLGGAKLNEMKSVSRI